MNRFCRVGAWSVLTVLAAWCTAAGQAPTAPATKPAVLLQTDSNWRYLESWRTEVVRVGPALVAVDALDPRATQPATGMADPSTAPTTRAVRQMFLKPAARVHGSPLPPEGWAAPDFDDADWLSLPGPFRHAYRNLARISLRGRFRVDDPAAVTALSLTLAYRGGVVVYLNGQEVARGHVPAGPLTAETVAEDYPPQASVTADGALRQNIRNTSDLIPVYTLDASTADRTRRLSVPLPPAALRKGVNVLAVAVVRAPAAVEMLTRVPARPTHECLYRLMTWWNRCGLEEAQLVAAVRADAPDAVAGNARARSVDLWAAPSYTQPPYGDPHETQALRLHAPRNGVASGQVFVASAGAIQGLSATASDLTGPAGRIPAAAIQLRYVAPAPYATNHGPTTLHDALEESPPPQVPPGKNGTAVQAVWVTARVPADAAPGRYSGAVALQTAGAAPRQMPLTLEVIDYVLPDPAGLRVYVGLPESPDSVAMYYNLPPWSPEHFKHLDKVFAFLGQIGQKEIYVTAIRQTHFGNEHAMLRWIRQGDGTLVPDLAIVEKYLDTALKHLGTSATVIVYVHEIFGRSKLPTLWITEVDPKTGALTAAEAPSIDTPAGQAMVQAMVDALTALLKKRRIDRPLTFGMIGDANAGVNEPLVAALHKAAPDAGWALRSHWFYRNVGKTGAPFTRLANVSGICGVFWDPETDEPFYGWRNETAHLIWARDDLSDYSGVGIAPSEHFHPTSLRLAAEGSVLSGRRYGSAHGAGRGNVAGQVGQGFAGFRGFGDLGADFWPVLESPKGKLPLSARYPDVSWVTLHIHAVMASLLAPGRDGPVSTVRFEMIREGLQEAQARIAVQEALLDEAARAALGADLAEQARRLCNDRTRMFRHFSEYYFGGSTIQGMSGSFWQQPSRDLYRLAGQVRR